MDINWESTSTVIYPAEQSEFLWVILLENPMMHIYVKETNQKPLIGLIDIPYKMKIALVLSYFQ